MGEWGVSISQEGGVGRGVGEGTAWQVLGELDRAIRSFKKTSEKPLGKPSQGIKSRQLLANLPFFGIL